jgi:serine/threonine-protein kinase
MLFDRFSAIEPIEKGWSEDKKFCVTLPGGERALLRVSPAARFAHREALHAIKQRVAALGVPIPRPLAFGACEEGVYTLEAWIDGEDLAPILPQLPPEEQKRLGFESGEFLRRIHSIEAPAGQEDWALRFGKKTDRKLQTYLKCPLRFEGDERIIAYLRENRGLLEGRPQCFQHGDYHAGNMMLESGQLRIIDFDRCDYGDPWEEFNRIVWSASASPLFASAQLRGYFGGEPPIAFFQLLCFYIASNTLSSIYWAIPFGQGEIDTMMKQSQEVLRWYRGMQNPVPSWYVRES